MIIHKLSSGKKTTNTLIYTGKCFYYGFTAVPGGTDRNVTVYDNTEASGTIVEDFDADGNKKTDGHSHSKPVYCGTGLYLALDGGTAIVYYAPIPTTYLEPSTKKV